VLHAQIVKQRHLSRIRTATPARGILRAEISCTWGWLPGPGRRLASRDLSGRVWL